MALGGWLGSLEGSRIGSIERSTRNEKARSIQFEPHFYHALLNYCLTIQVVSSWKYLERISELIFLDGSGIDGCPGDGSYFRFASLTEATAIRTLHWVLSRVGSIMVDQKGSGTVVRFRVEGGSGGSKS
jgi:hypothetical protein